MGYLQAVLHPLFYAACRGPRTNTSAVSGQDQPLATPPGPLVAAMDGPPDSALGSVFSQVQHAAAADGPSAASPAPAPTAAAAAVPALDQGTAPAPAVRAASGPADTQQQQQQTLFGWRIITRSASPSAADAAVAAATDVPSQQAVFAGAAGPSAAPAAPVVFPWTAAASLRHQVDSALTQYFGALCGSPGCAAEKRAMWRAGMSWLG